MMSNLDGNQAVDTSDSPELPDPQPNQQEWVVIRTRPRCEKKVARFCEVKSTCVYLPLLSRTHQYGGRTRTFTSPLFSGYVFALLDLSDMGGVQQHQNVARLIRTLDQAGLVEQLRAVQKALHESELVEVLPYLATGRRVVVKSGPLKGSEGVIERRKGKTRVIINVEMIQHSVAIEVDSQLLAPL